MTDNTSAARPHLRVVYTDLDGSLLGSGGSIFRDALGAFSFRQAEALYACYEAGVEVVPTTGRQRMQAAADARMLGLSSIIYELGGGVLIDGREISLTGSWQPIDGAYPAEQITLKGVPRVLFERFAGLLEYHAPWHEGRRYTVLLRGRIDVDVATHALRLAGYGDLELRDNGVIDEPMPGIAEVHAYHLLPDSVSKAAAVAFHMQERGYAPDEGIAFGDSFEDLGVASLVGRMYVPANGPQRDPALAAAVEFSANTTVTSGRMGDGFAEAVFAELVQRGQLTQAELAELRDRGHLG